MIKHLSKKDDLKELVKDGIHIVDFYGEWCGPCKFVGGELEKVQDKYDIIKVDIDEFDDLAEEQRIMAIPALIFFKDGERKGELIGFHFVKDIDEMFEKVKSE